MAGTCAPLRGDRNGNFNHFVCGSLSAEQDGDCGDAAVRHGGLRELSDLYTAFTASVVRIWFRCSDESRRMVFSMAFSDLSDSGCRVHSNLTILCKGFPGKGPGAPDKGADDDFSRVSVPDAGTSFRALSWRGHSDAHLWIQQHCCGRFWDCSTAFAGDLSVWLHDGAAEEKFRLEAL